MPERIQQTDFTAILLRVIWLHQRLAEFSYFDFIRTLNVHKTELPS